jgi:D-alanyl-D-alanine carboxypeptidase
MQKHFLNLDLGFDRDIYITKLKYDDKKIIPKINLFKKIKAPVRINQNLGTIDFVRDNNIIATEKIYSLKRVEEGNLYRRAYDIVANFFIED